METVVTWLGARTFFQSFEAYRTVRILHCLIFHQGVREVLLISKAVVNVATLYL